MALLKYATFAGDVVDTITFYPDRDADGNVLVGQELVSDDVFAGFIRGVNGSFSPPPSEIVPVSNADVNLERDRRVSTGTTVAINGYGMVPLQGRDQDQANLLGLVTAANLRIASGDTATLTKFRDAENVDHMLTPPQIVEMWSKGSAWISAVYDTSWTIKAMNPIPADYADDSRWP